jgi:hypothetical protein
MASSIGKVANWLAQVPTKSRAVVGLWWPAAVQGRGRSAGATRVQDAFLKKHMVKQGPLSGYKIALTSPQILAQTGLKGPCYGPIRRKRVFEHKASIRADAGHARRRARGRLVMGATCRSPRPSLRQGLDRRVCRRGARRLRVIEDRGADYSRLAVNPLIMDAAERRLPAGQAEQGLAQARDRQA